MPKDFNGKVPTDLALCMMQYLRHSLDFYF